MILQLSQKIVTKLIVYTILVTTIFVITIKLERKEAK